MTLDYTKAAKELIQDVEGIISEENIVGVASVFKAIVDVNNLQWEQHITKETNKALAIDDITCPCGVSVQIRRTSKLVYADII